MVLQNAACNRSIKCFSSAVLLHLLHDFNWENSLFFVLDLCALFCIHSYSLHASLRIFTVVVLFNFNLKVAIRWVSKAQSRKSPWHRILKHFFSTSQIIWNKHSICPKQVSDRHLIPKWFQLHETVYFWPEEKYLWCDRSWISEKRADGERLSLEKFNRNSSRALSFSILTLHFDQLVKKDEFLWFPE